MMVQQLRKRLILLLLLLAACLTNNRGLVESRQTRPRRRAEALRGRKLHQHHHNVRTLQQVASDDTSAMDGAKGINGGKSADASEQNAADSGDSLDATKGMMMYSSSSDNKSSSSSSTAKGSTSNSSGGQKAKGGSKYAMESEGGRSDDDHGSKLSAKSGNNGSSSKGSSSKGNSSTGGSAKGSSSKGSGPTKKSKGSMYDKEGRSDNHGSKLSSKGSSSKGNSSTGGSVKGSSSKGSGLTKKSKGSMNDKEGRSDDHGSKLSSKGSSSKGSSSTGGSAKGSGLSNTSKGSTTKKSVGKSTKKSTSTSKKGKQMKLTHTGSGAKGAGENSVQASSGDESLLLEQADSADPPVDLTDAPVVEETDPPEVTDPPVVEETDPPVEVTDPPVVEETDPPLVEETDPPAETTDPPVVEETDPPVVIDTDPPVEATDPPVVEDTDTPVVEETDPPVEITGAPVLTDPPIEPTTPPVEATDAPTADATLITGPSVEATDPPVATVAPTESSTEAVVEATVAPTETATAEIAATAAPTPGSSEEAGGDDFFTIDNDICVDAIELEVGDVAAGTTAFATGDEGVPACDDAVGSLFPETSGDLTIQLLGVWFAVEATDSRLRASVCSNTANLLAPMIVTVYAGDDNCSDLTCAPVYNTAGCSVEWMASSDSEKYYILVQSVVVQGTPLEINSDLDFELSISESVTPSNDVCEGAIPMELGDTVAAQTLSASEKDIEGACALKLQPPSPNVMIPGVWFSVVGNGDSLIASTCNDSTQSGPILVTIYSGSCDALQCETFEVGDVGPCSSGVSSTVEGQVYYILVEKVLRGDDEGVFELAVDGSK